MNTLYDFDDAPGTKFVIPEGCRRIMFHDLGRGSVSKQCFLETIGVDPRRHEIDEIALCEGSVLAPMDIAKLFPRVASVVINDSHAASLSGLENCSHLTSLGIPLCSSSCKMDAISQLRLKALLIRLRTNSDWSNILKCQTVGRLVLTYVRRDNINDVDNLLCLKSLRILSAGIIDVSLPQLKLTLCEFYGCRNLREIQKLRSAELKITLCKHCDLLSIRNVGGLKRLEIINCSSWPSFSVLGNSIDLEEIILHKVSFNSLDLHSLAPLTKLKKIWLGGKGLSVKDLQQFSWQRPDVQISTPKFKIVAGQMTQE